MRIIALGGGFLSATVQDRVFNEYVLNLVDSPRPKVCLVPTASGDSPGYIVSFYESFPADQCRPSHLTLFHRAVEDLRSFLLGQDIIYVSGGNTANMLAVWRVHGLDTILREAWENGVVLCGSSAGALCWFEGGSTDSFGTQLAAIDGCLGFLPGSHCPHYNSEPGRRETYHRFVREGMPPGWALDDGAALHFEGRELHRALSGREGAQAFYVERSGEGVRETSLELEPLWQ